MQTLDATAAAAFLYCGEDTVIGMAASGEIPAAKVGRKWVFVDVDLIEWLRAQYHATKQPDEKPEKKPCQSTKGAKRGGYISATKGKGFDDLLGLPTRTKPSESTTNSRPSSGSVVQMHTLGTRP